MFSLLAEMARSERETLVERINSGLAKARREGKRLGRPAGSSLSPKEFLATHKDVVKQLRAGHSIRNTAKITGKSVSTVQRVKAAMPEASSVPLTPSEAAPLRRHMKKASKWMENKLAKG